VSGRLELPDRRLRVAFFGTPDIARTILDRLFQANADDVALVVSQPDRPRGRGKKVEPTPVKALAEARGVEVVQPLKLKDGVLAAQIRRAEIDLGIVVAYGRILPIDLFEAPRFRTWNVHASLLPRHRGASPIQHAILAGDRETGVTLMQLSEGMDEGAVLLSAAIPLDGTETGGGLTERLARLGADVLIEGLGRAKRGGLTVTPQDPSRATSAPLLEKKDGELDLSLPAAVLERKVRAFDPWPSASLVLGGEAVKVLRAQVVASRGEPGRILECGPRLILATCEGALEIVELQPPGKRPMAAADFLRGAGRSLVIGAAVSAKPPARS
jgi:methionyl-tRNA formyltransferase